MYLGAFMYHFLYFSQSFRRHFIYEMQICIFFFYPKIQEGYQQKKINICCHQKGIEGEENHVLRYILYICNMLEFYLKFVVLLLSKHWKVLAAIFFTYVLECFHSLWCLWTVFNRQPFNKSYL